MAVDVCCIQETYLKDQHRFFIRGFEVFRQDRKGKHKGGLVTLVRNTIPAVETKSSGQAELDTEFLGVKLVLTDGPLTVLNVYSPPDKQIQLDSIPVDDRSWIITGDFNSHSPSWGYQDLNRKGEDVENWTISNQLLLINRPDDPPTFYSRTWRTTSTPDLAFATDDLHGIAKREVNDQLGGSDHRPVVISIQRQFDSNFTRLPPSWNYKKANWDLFKLEADQKMSTEMSSESISHHDINKNAKAFNQIVLEAARKAIPRGRRRNFKPYWTPELNQLEEKLNEARDKMESVPTDENVATHNRAKAIFIKEKTQAARRSWHDKTASLNTEKNMDQLWKLTKDLNDDNPSRGKTVLLEGNQFKTGKAAADTFATLYEKESTIYMGRQRTKLVREETSKLLSSDPPAPEDRCMSDLLTMKELKQAIRKLKSKKAPGPDGITGDMLKHLGPAAKTVLLQIFNQSWSEGYVPPIWKKGRDHSYRKEREKQERRSKLQTNQFLELCR